MSDETRGQPLDLNAILEDAANGRPTHPNTVVRLVRLLLSTKRYLDDIDAILSEAMALNPDLIDSQTMSQDVPVQRITARRRQKGLPKN